MSFFERNSAIIAIVLIGVAVLILLHLYGNTGGVTYSRYSRAAVTNNNAKNGCVLGRTETTNQDDGTVVSNFVTANDPTLRSAVAFFRYVDNENDVINRSKNICTALGEGCKAFTMIKYPGLWSTHFLTNDINTTLDNDTSQLRCANDIDYQQGELRFMQNVKTYKKN
jgi:hypothetical protein